MCPKGWETGRFRWKFGGNHCKGRTWDGMRMVPGWDRDGVRMGSEVGWDEDGIRNGNQDGIGMGGQDGIEDGIEDGIGIKSE